MDEGQLPTWDEIDKAFQKLLHKYAYSTKYGKADKESIIEAIYKKPIDEQAYWQRTIQKHIEKEAEKLAEVMAEDMVIEHENAPEGLEYYKTMDRWNKRKIEQLEEENKKLKEEVERLKKEKRNNRQEEELKKELEKVKFENGNFVQGARTNKDLIDFLEKKLKLKITKIKIKKF